MNLKEIRESGLLELYVLGLLSEEEAGQVRSALGQYPELVKDINEIEKALEVYGKATAVTPPDSARSDVLSKIRSRGPSPDSSGGGASWKLLSLVLSLVAIGIIVALITTIRGRADDQRTSNDLQIALDSCTAQNAALNAELTLLQNLIDPSNQALAITPTPTYPNTNLFFHHNSSTSRNFIQVINLPAITTSQSYQLWSLKPGVAPIPLDVFEDDRGPVFEVSYEDDTETYAITIEPRGGQQSPTLDQLIGTVAISGD